MAEQGWRQKHILAPQLELTLEEIAEWDKMLEILGLTDSYYDTSWSDVNDYVAPRAIARGHGHDNEITTYREYDHSCSENNVRYCPVPKIKGLYYPTPEQLIKQFRNENCNIQKKLPGTLGGAHTGSLSNAQRRGQWLSLRASSRGHTRFVVNGNALGMRAGQPGGIMAPVRNRF
jgi:hypothetical protein